MELTGIQQEIWEKKYKYKDDTCIEDTWRRVARSAASIEKDKPYWEDKFYSILEDFKFIPGGRITESLGTDNQYANNCFALDIEDDIENIYETVKRCAVISKKNGGIGICFDKIRPINSPLSGGGVGSGVVSFMKIFDTSCSVIKTGSKNRRAALIGLLSCSHPEIFDFIDAKRQENVLTNFNISVLITDSFIEAVKSNSDWDLTFNGKIYNTVKAKDLWDKLCYSGWMYNDPGLFLVDNVNRTNNLYYIQKFNTCNPCGELPLFPWGACCLGNINITKFIKEAFSDGQVVDLFDFESYKEVIKTSVRFLDNIINVSEYPYEQNKEIALRDRRIGLNGLAGLGSALAMLCISYDSKKGRDFAGLLSKICRDESYKASIELAREKGSFTSFNKDKYLQGEFIKSLPLDIQNDIDEYGIRNCAILTCPPVGTGSMLAGNISSGIEPIFALEYGRKILQTDGSYKIEFMEDYAWRLWKEQSANKLGTYAPPVFFKTAVEIEPKAHILMQAILQKYIDGSISKTCNLPEEYTLEQYKDLLMFAYENGLKGWTTFRSGTREGVLTVKPDKKKESKTEVKDEINTTFKVKRPRVLDGKTYQIQEENKHRTYMTVNHTEENGIKKPWEMFLFSSSKNHELYAAIGRLASRLMRKTGDAQGVIDDLKEIGGDNGYFTPEYGFVNSKPQHFGYILEEYVNQLNATVQTEKQESGEKCSECNGKILRIGGCSQCENGCPESFKCG